MIEEYDYKYDKELTNSLIDKAQQGDQDAVSKLLEIHYNLCWHWAHKMYISEIKIIDIEDLANEAVFGLISAIHKFDKTRDISFSTYATPWICQRISRYYANNATCIRLPVHVREKLYAINQKLNNGEDLTPEEYKIKLREVPVVSINEEVRTDEGDELLLENSISDDEAEGFVEEVAQDDAKTILLRELDKLNPREKYVIVTRYGLDGEGNKTLEEVGQTIGITRERVRQIEKHAIMKLKKNKQLASLLSCY